MNDFFPPKSRIVFDIETAGKRFDDLDEYTKSSLIKKVSKKLGVSLPQQHIDPAKSAESDSSMIIREIDTSLGLNPYLGQVIAIGLHDFEIKKNVLLLLKSDTIDEEVIKDSVLKHGPACAVIFASEAEILAEFWRIVYAASEVISFYGGRFDLPYIMVRSAAHHIKPSVNLIKHYKHADLYPLLSFYGSLDGVSLHSACTGFGIETPKNDIDGSKVSEYFYAGKLGEIGAYCMRDVLATAQLYDIWKKYLDFSYDR
ncbi:MAG: 3'-5' exonuclease, PolB [Parcubacteria group bacterium GW2011_GWC1_41_7]|nr:MAG: 3'-5' exonuclease, PolB [Parcubacteria group bacterium GW2011_GWC1_41_7]